MRDTTPQRAEGKVLMHFSMSLDGFVAGPGHSMDWMREDATNRPGLIEEYVATTGAVLGGRDGWDAFPDPERPTAVCGQDPSSFSPTTPRTPCPPAV